jgi:hypothetical protein
MSREPGICTYICSTRSAQSIPDIHVIFLRTEIVVSHIVNMNRRFLMSLSFYALIFHTLVLFLPAHQDQLSHHEKADDDEPVRVLFLDYIALHCMHACMYSKHHSEFVVKWPWL